MSSFETCECVWTQSFLWLLLYLTLISVASCLSKAEILRFFLSFRSVLRAPFQFFFDRWLNRLICEICVFLSSNFKKVRSLFPTINCSFRFFYPGFRFSKSVNFPLVYSMTGSLFKIEFKSSIHAWFFVLLRCLHINSSFCVSRNSYVAERFSRLSSL